MAPYGSKAALTSFTVDVEGVAKAIKKKKIHSFSTHHSFDGGWMKLKKKC